jgi:hypothetical protein
MPLLRAQSAPPPQDPGSSQPNQPLNTKRPTAQQPKPSEANPFPEDTTTVPVVPTNLDPAALAPAPVSADSGTTTLLHDDTDPIKSPEDAALSGTDSGFSSSLQGSDDVKVPEDVEKPSKHQKLAPPPHQVTAKDDENVGAYYLSLKNWKAALSRFESALVTDPENPDVYWGLAESQRQLGDLANAKANYLKVVDYDPDSKHGKEAKKILKQPEIANAPAVSANQPAAQTQQ